VFQTTQLSHFCIWRGTQSGVV